MSQARARSFQTAKSLNYLYKVCIGTNTSRSYCSGTSFKALSSVKKISTLNSVATNESFHLQNPNQFPGTGKNSCAYGSEYDRNPNGQRYNMGEDCLHRQGQYNTLTSYSTNASSSQQISGTSYRNLHGSYNGMLNSQVPTYFQPNEKSDKSGKERQLLEELDSLCKERKLKEAVEILGLLEKNNVSVDIPRYLFLLNECGESQALEEAQHVHDHLIRSLPYVDVSIHNKILETYSKCGSMEKAYEVFDNMPKRNLTSWDTMITWLAKNGYGEDAIEMFTEFKEVGLKPDNQMFHGVFSACSVVGDMNEGLLHFESMIKTYNLVPSIDDYVSVVDMLGSSGYLNEALKFIEKMHIKPSVKIWESVMNQSRVHGDLELGDRCAEIVNLLDPFRLDEQSKKGLIPVKPLDIAKEENKSWRFNSRLHEYSDGDTSHPDHEKLYSQLMCLKQPMKEAGYVPNTKVVLHDVDQESKEEDLLSQSERLALSKALLTTPARHHIRILKNKRVSVDSHNALKIISKLVGRQITYRDELRFHCFKNGVCSCGDYW